MNSSAHSQDKKFLVILTCLNLLLISTTLAAFFITRATLEREKLKVFLGVANIIEQKIEERMLHHINTLKSLQAFFKSHNQDVSYPEFSLFLESLNIFNNFPSISSVGFIKRQNNQYLSAYVEPQIGRTQTIGHNHSADPDRKPAFDLARDSGEIISSDPFTLITTGRPGFFLIAPLYAGNITPKSFVERQEKLTGFLVIVFRENELFNAIFGRQDPLPNISFNIYNNKNYTPEHLLYASNSSFNPTIQSNSLQTKRFITIGNKPWEVQITTKPSFRLDPIAEKLPLAVLIFGGICSLIFSLAIGYFYRRHLKTWH